MSDEPRVEWTRAEKIAEILDVSTAACTYCGGAARVPEDVAAVYESGDQVVPVVVCPACVPTFMRDIERRVEDDG